MSPPSAKGVSSSTHLHFLIEKQGIYLLQRPHAAKTSRDGPLQGGLQLVVVVDLVGTVDLGHVAQQVEDTAGVAPLVVVPGDELDEVVVKADTGLGVDDGAGRVAAHVGGDDVVLSVVEDALELALGGLLQGLLDLLVAGTLLDAAGQVNDGDVLGRHTHGHASQLAVQARDDLADGLSGTGGRWDDVGGSSAATAPVLARWAVDGLLGGGVGVNGSHETLDHVVLVVDDLGERGQAVGGAGGVGDDGDVALVAGVVDTHDEHGGVSGRSGDDDLLGAALQVSLSLLGGGEDTGGLDDVLGAGLGPRDGGRVLLHVEADLLAVDDQVLAVNLDGALEDAVGGVVLEHVGGVVRLNERVVAGNDVNVRVLDGIAEDNADNTAKSVDTDLDDHFGCELGICVCRADVCGRKLYVKVTGECKCLFGGSPC